MQIKPFALFLTCTASIYTLSSYGAPNLDEPPQGASVSSPLNLFAEPGTTILPARKPDTVVAQVNGKPLLHKNVEIELNALKKQFSQSMSPVEVEKNQSKMAEWAMDAAVLKILLIEELEERGISNTPEEVEAAVNKIRANLPEGVTFESFVAKDGRSEAEVRETMALDIRLEKLLNEVMSAAQPPSEEHIVTTYEQNKSYYEVPERVRTRHILLAVTETTPDEEKNAKRKLAEQLLEQLKGGADFAELAKAHSDDATSAQGGELGLIARGTTVPPFEEAIFSRQPGDWGTVVQTKFGYHLIDVISKEPARTLTLEEVRPALVKNLTSTERQNKLQQYFSQLKSNAEITFPK